MAEFLPRLSENEREELRRIVRLAGKRLFLLTRQVAEHLGLPPIAWVEIYNEITHVAVLALTKGASVGDDKVPWASVKRNRRKFTPGEIEQIAKLRKHGLSYGAVADKLGCPKRAVERFCKKNGLERGGLTTFIIKDEVD